MNDSQLHTDSLPDPAEIDADATLTETTTSVRCSFCDQQAVVWVEESYQPGTAHSRPWCGDHFGANVPADPEFDPRPFVPTAESWSEYVAVQRFLDRRTAFTETGGVAASLLHERYTDFCADEGAETLVEAAFVGRVLATAPVEAERPSGETDGAESDVYLRGVIPA